MNETPKHVYRTAVGMRIRRERVLWNMTQDDLSQELGISSGYLGQIERGTRDISRKMEDRLCELFHLTHEEFRRQNGLDPYWNTEVAEGSFFHDMTEEDLLRLLRSCDPYEFQFCGHMIRSCISFMRKFNYNTRQPVVTSLEPQPQEDPSEEPISSVPGAGSYLFPVSSLPPAPVSQNN